MEDFTLYEDQYCYYVWKPAWIPSTFWKEKSFLEYIFESKKHQDFIESQKKEFTEEEEYGLLNRLDTLTTGLLYFAKNHKIKEEYKELQKQWRVNKIYLLKVYWDIRYRIEKNWRVIQYPIAHHKYQEDRMVVITTDDMLKKWDKRLHRVETKILKRERDEVEQITTVIVTIQKWIRHQIRSHFSAIWYPIVWDPLYWKKKDERRGFLELSSVGLIVK